jgi:hypothetical protein
MSGQELIQKLMSPYPGLPVINENQEVNSIVSEYDVLNAVR